MPMRSRVKGSGKGRPKRLSDSAWVHHPGPILHISLWRANHREGEEFLKKKKGEERGGGDYVKPSPDFQSPFSEILIRAGCDGIGWLRDGLYAVIIQTDLMTALEIDEIREMGREIFETEFSHLRFRYPEDRIVLRSLVFLSASASNIKGARELMDFLLGRGQALLSRYAVPAKSNIPGPFNLTREQILPSSVNIS